jgi:hypothetical protein
MPSRIRIVLRHKAGALYVGKRAVYQVFQSLPAGVAQVIRKEFKSKLARLRAAIQELPPDWTLILIREQRGLRKNRSLYWKMRAGYQPMQAPPEQRWQQIAADAINLAVARRNAPQRGRE